MLPSEQKSLIVETVQNFAAYKKVRKLLESDGSAGAVFLAADAPPWLLSLVSSCCRCRCCCRVCDRFAAKAVL